MFEKTKKIFEVFDPMNERTRIIYSQMSPPSLQHSFLCRSSYFIHFYPFLDSQDIEPFMYYILFLLSDGIVRLF